MILLGELRDYDKTNFEILENNTEFCYCTEVSTYMYMLDKGVITDYAYLDRSGRHFVNNEQKKLLYPVIVPSVDKSILDRFISKNGGDEKYFYESKYGLYLLSKEYDIIKI